jgi:hypothetical protein
MGTDVRIGIVSETSRKASGVKWRGKATLPSGGSQRQNVMEIELEFASKKTLSKIKDEPTKSMKINKLINDKKPDAMMLLNPKGLA